MKLRAKESVWGLLIWVIMVSFGGMGEVRAQTVDEAIQCDNCPNFREIAHFYGMHNGPGLKVVADFQTGQIKAFKHVIEGPDRYTRPSGVPDNVRNVFDFWMDVMMAGTASAEAYGKASEDKARGVVITVHADESVYSTFTFPREYANRNAYDIVNNATLRSQFETRMAQAASWANTSSSTFNKIAFSVQSLGFSQAARLFAVDAVTIVVKWADGSETQLRITPSSVTEAEYIAGKSKDPDGNKIPDASVTQSGSSGGPSYVGTYTFSNNNYLENWLNAARNYGVPVTRGEGGGVKCSWDGRTLECIYNIY